MGAVLYALLIGLLVYRTLSWKSITGVMTNSAGTTASLMVLVGFTNLFGWILVSEQVPQSLAEWLLTITGIKYLLLLLVTYIPSLSLFLPGLAE